jgi:hypothetical protein
MLHVPRPKLLEAYQLKHGFNLRLIYGFGLTAHAQRVSNVLFHSEVGEELVVLKHQANTALVGWYRRDV